MTYNNWRDSFEYDFILKILKNEKPFNMNSV